MTLAAGEYIVVARNLAAFEAFYGTWINAIGDYDPDKLSNDGEDVLLQMPEPYDAAILRFDYNDDWYTPTDGDGPSLVLRDFVLPDYRARRTIWGNQGTWRPSQVDGGSPGADEPVAELAAGSVAINEVLAHSDLYPNDWIEVRNTTDQAIDIGGWWLSDDPADLTKYLIAEGTILPAADPEDENAGYIVFTQDDNFGDASSDPGKVTSFGLSEHGDEAIISSANIEVDPGAYRDYVVFGATENGVPLGRHISSTGRAQFVAMSEATVGPTYANAAPAVGPLVFEEIMYHPEEGEYEYILLRNISGSDVPLYDEGHPLNTWQFTEGIEFGFPEGVVVLSGGVVLISEVDSATYLARYGVPAEVQVFGPYTGNLSDGGETLTLAKPGEPQVFPDFVPYITAESVKYNDNFPWPSEPDGDEAALHRLVSGEYGDDPVNWGASFAPELVGLTVDASSDVRQPEFTLEFSKTVYADASDVTVFDASMAPVAASFDLTGSGTETLVITFNAPLLYGGPYTISFGAAGIGDLTGRAPLGGPVEVSYMAAIAGDVNVDQSVDLADLAIMGHPSHWGQSGMTWLEGDLDGNGIVNEADLAILREAFLAPKLVGLTADASSDVRQPEFALEFSKIVYADASDLVVLDASMTPVAADFSLIGSGTNTLVISFNAPLVYGGPYIISFGAEGIGDLAGRVPLGGPVEVTYMAAIAGDVNVDESVDLADLAIMGHPNHWGQSGMTWLEGDLDGDGIVNGFDLVMLSAAYGDRFSVSAGAVVSKPLTPPGHDPSIPFGPQLPTVVDSTSGPQAIERSVADGSYPEVFDSTPSEDKAVSPDLRFSAADAAALALIAEDDSDEPKSEFSKTRLEPHLLDLLAEEQIGRG